MTDDFWTRAYLLSLGQYDRVKHLEELHQLVLKYEKTKYLKVRDEMFSLARVIKDMDNERK